MARRAAQQTWEAMDATHPGVRHPRARRAGQWPATVNALVVACFSLLTLAALWSAASESPVGDADRWTIWSADSPRFWIEHPAGWRVVRREWQGELQVAIIRSRWLRVHVSISRLWPGGSITWDDVRFVHRETRWRSEVEAGSITEGRPELTTIGGRPAAWSRFTARGSHIVHGEPLQGYRATIIGDGWAAIVTAVAPAEHFDDFRPLALRIIRSIRFADGQG